MEGNRIRRRKRQFVAACLTVLMVLQNLSPMTVWAELKIYGAGGIKNDEMLAQIDGMLCSDYVKVDVVYYAVNSEFAGHILHSGDQIVFKAGECNPRFYYQKTDETQPAITEDLNAASSEDNGYRFYSVKNPADVDPVATGWRVLKIIQSSAGQIYRIYLQAVRGGDYEKNIDYVVTQPWNDSLPIFYDNPRYYVVGKGVNSFEKAFVGENYFFNVDFNNAHPFLGWFSDEAYTQQITSIPATANEEYTLYALFKGYSGRKIEYYDAAGNKIPNVGATLAGVSFARQSTSVDVVPEYNPDTYTEGIGEESIGGAVTDDEYYDEFEGWYDAPDEGNKVGNGSCIPKNAHGDLKLYARFKRKTYTINYRNIDDTDASVAGNPTAYSYGISVSANSFYPPAAKTGYTGRWYDAKEGGNDISASGISATVSGNLILYAQYTPHTYKVQYDKNAEDAEGAGGNDMADSDFTYDTAGNLSKNTYTRSHYIFDKWNTKADGTGTSYADEAAVNNLTAEDGATIKLYTQWKTKKYTITWKDGDGNVIKTEQVEYGKTPAYEGDTPSKTADDQFTYEFNNTWSPAVAAVTEDAEYAAQFTGKAKKTEPAPDPTPDPTPEPTPAPLPTPTPTPKPLPVDDDSSEKDEKGSVFGELLPGAGKVTKTSIEIKWKKEADADGYMIYGALCNKSKEKHKFQHMATVGPDTTSWMCKKLKKNSYYKFYVIAFRNENGTAKELSRSKKLHVTTLNPTYGNATGIKLGKSAFTLKKGQKRKISAWEIPEGGKKIKHHRDIEYESSDPSIATVTATGLVKAKKKGKCKIWVYAQNGVYKTVTVKVK